MKKWKKIIVAILVIVCAYFYAHVGETGFDLETFCVFLILILYIIVFFKFLEKLFSR